MRRPSQSREESLQAALMNLSRGKMPGAAQLCAEELGTLGCLIAKKQEAEGERGKAPLGCLHHHGDFGPCPALSVSACCLDTKARPTGCEPALGSHTCRFGQHGGLAGVPPHLITRFVSETSRQKLQKSAKSEARSHLSPPAQSGYLSGSNPHAQFFSSPRIAFY